MIKKVLNIIIVATIFFTNISAEAYSKYYEKSDLYNYRKSIVVDTQAGNAKAYYY